MQGLPLVSIVTPSFNKDAFIEETILSVKAQTYPYIEHIVIDGGSTDKTLDILRRHSNSIIWISEPDSGQSDAINKGWKIAKGEILAYLNADDIYMPWTVETAVKLLGEHPDVDMVYGKCNIIDEQGELIMECPATEFNLSDLVCGTCGLPQPTVFFRKKIIDTIGYLDADLHMAMDLDFWIRAGLLFKIKYIPQILANFRVYPGTKTVNEPLKCADECLCVLNKVFFHADLPGEVKAVKSRAYSYVHLRLGLEYCLRGQMKQARRSLVKSVMLYPWHFRRPALAGILVASFIGKGTLEKARNLKQRLEVSLLPFLSKDISANFNKKVN